MTIDVLRLRVWRQQYLAIAQLPVTVLALVTLTLSLFAAGPGVLPGDVAFTRWIQSAPDGTIGTLFRVMNAIGETPAMLAIGAILAVISWQRGRLDAMFLIATASIARSLNPVLKALFESPRPTADLVHVDHISSGWGFPSGHVMGMTLLVGALVCLAWDTWPRRRSHIATVIIASLVLLTSGAGRIYVGAHWPTDVLGAYLYGTLGTIGLVWTWQHRLALTAIRSRLSFTAPVLTETDVLSAPSPATTTTITLSRRRISAVALGSFLAAAIVFASMAI